MSINILKVFIFVVATICSAVSAPAVFAFDLAIHGDSTGRGHGAQTKWFQQLDQFADAAAVENFARDRNSITGAAKLVEANPLPQHVTIVYDRRNAGETVDDYIDTLHEIADTLGNGRFLILPQVPVSGGREDGLTLPILLEINERIRAEFPANTFDQSLEADFLAALADDETRADRIHRNDAGQRIEAEYICEWLSSQDW